MAMPAAGAAPGGINLKSPVAGPSGPGGGPMLSPGTGAGMEAQAAKRVSKIIDMLLEIGATVPKDSGKWNAISRAISALNGVFTADKKDSEPKPLPMPPTPPPAPMGGAGPAPPPQGTMGGGLPGG